MINKSDNQLYWDSIRIGQFAALIIIIVGIFIILLGFSGSIHWVIETPGISAKIYNASPGIIICLIGMIILWKYKPKLTQEIRSKKINKPCSVERYNEDMQDDIDFYDADHLRNYESSEIHIKHIMEQERPTDTNNNSIREILD